VQRLGELAAKLNNPMLSAMAVKAALMGPDRFVKVRGIIEDHVARLEAEKVAEASQKNSCDVEMTEVLENRDKFKLEMEEKAALIQQKTSFIAATNQEIAVLSQEMADLSKALDEANVDFTKLMCEVMVQGGFRPKTDDGLTKHELIKNKRGKVTLQKAAAACATKRVRKIAKSKLAKPAFQGGLKPTSRWTVDAVRFQVFARS
jgi:hypothetical protein